MFQYAALERNNTTEPLGGREKKNNHTLALQADRAPKLHHPIAQLAQRDPAAQHPASALGSSNARRRLWMCTAHLYAVVSTQRS